VPFSISSRHHAESPPGDEVRLGHHLAALKALAQRRPGHPCAIRKLCRATGTWSGTPPAITVMVRSSEVTQLPPGRGRLDIGGHA